MSLENLAQIQEGLTYDDVLLVSGLFGNITS